MNIKSNPYKKYALIHEMFDTVRIIREFKTSAIGQIFTVIKGDSKLILTGEGSSRIFPANNMRHHQMALGNGPQIFLESSTQLLTYPLEEYIVIGASNSGKTKEIIELFDYLVSCNHPNLYAVTCYRDTPLQRLAKQTIILEHCNEIAVAATKSVVAEALVYESILMSLKKYNFRNDELADKFQNILNSRINKAITKALLNAATVYFVGNNNGVAEELTLKTNEILRKKSAYLPGTYLLHGIEEVINSNDVLVIVDPLESEFEKIIDIYQKKIGATIIALESFNCPFLTCTLPRHNFFEDGYLKLSAGWNLLAETGIMMGIDIDKPERARKIGNEFYLAH